MEFAVSLARCNTALAGTEDPGLIWNAPAGLIRLGNRDDCGNGLVDFDTGSAATFMKRTHPSFRFEL
jgi:hypothetical protein